MAQGSSTSEAQSGWRGFLLILLSLVVEGFDLQAANFAAPSVVEAFGVSKADIGPFLSASLFGVLIGAVFVGPLGDRVGRRRILIASCLAYGGLSLAAAFAQDLWHLVALRFLIGIGLGGVLPNALALAGELAPRRHLARATGIVGIGITFGGVVAGVVAAQCLPLYGWPSLFLVGGVLPIAIAVLLWAALPESPALAVLSARTRASEIGVRRLLGSEWRGQTIGIWCVFAAVLMVVYLLSGWIPLLIHDQGYSTATASWVATGAHVGGVAGGVVASLLLHRRPWLVVAIFAAFAAIALGLLAAFDWGVVGLALLIGVVGFFSTGTQNGLNGSAGATYPVEIRASGLGWALGLGRVGSILGPLVGAAALSLGLPSSRTFFLLPIVPLLLAAALCWWLSRVSNQRRRRNDEPNAEDCD